MKRKEGLINIVKAADYLGCSHQWLYQMLKSEEDHPLKSYFTHYAGAWRTTIPLLDEFFSSLGDKTSKKQGEHNESKITPEV